MTTKSTVRAGNWNDFSCFMAGTYLHEREATHFLWYFGTNVDGLYAEANDQAIAKQFAAEIKAGDVETTRTGSGLRGVDIYGYLVRVVNPDGTPNAELIAKVEATIKRLSDYCILDEDIYGELESEQAWENVSDALRWNAEADWNVPARTEVEAWNTLVSDVTGWFDENSYECTRDGSYPDGTEIEEALEALGYEKYPDYPAGADCNEGVPA